MCVFSFSFSFSLRGIFNIHSLKKYEEHKAFIREHKALVNYNQIYEITMLQRQI
jgi:hypothetical protein